MLYLNFRNSSLVEVKVMEELLLLLVAAGIIKWLKIDTVIYVR